MATVRMAQLGESVVEGTVVRWIAKPGQRVERDEPIVEVSTDKANTEVPSPAAGVLIEQMATEGAVVAVGQPLARLDSGAGAQAAAPASAPQQASKAPPPTAPAQQQAPKASQPPPAREGDGNGVRASPVGRNVAQEHGLDLEKVSGSGVGGRITKADVLS